MHRSVLSDDGFVRWTHEAVALLVAHNELGHEEQRTTDSYGNAVRRCTLYPGLACRDHLDAAVDVDVARDEELVKVPFVELCPNTWLVAPGGEVTALTEEEQFSAAKLRARADKLQQTLGKALARDAFPRMKDLLEKADAAAEEERWKDALSRLAELLAPVKEPHASLVALVRARLDDIDGDAGCDFEDLRDDAKVPAAEKRKRLEDLLAALDVEVLGARVPTHAATKAWLAAPR
jgi:hypothetical protein